MKKRGLTKKQKIFCHEYILDWNATRAAKEAGYSEKTAAETGYENLRKPQIKAYIEEIQKNLEKEAGISPLRVLNEYSKLAFHSIADLHQSWIDRKDFEDLTDDQKACISEIHTRVVKRNIGTKEEPEIVNVEEIKVKLYDKGAALADIAKMLGYNEPDKHDHTVRPITGFNYVKPDDQADS